MLLKEKRKKEEILGSSISHEKAAAGRIPWFDLGVKVFELYECTYQKQ